MSLETHATPLDQVAASLACIACQEMDCCQAPSICRLAFSPKNLFRGYPERILPLRNLPSGASFRFDFKPDHWGTILVTMARNIDHFSISGGKVHKDYSEMISSVTTEHDLFCYNGEFWIGANRNFPWPEKPFLSS